MPKVNILGINFDNLNMKECIEKCNNFLNNDKLNTIVTANPEIIMVTVNDNEFKELINDSELVIADGIGVVIASKILKTKLKERVAGFDLISNIFENCDADKRVYLLGSKPGIAEKAKEEIEKRYNVKVVGLHDGYFNVDDEINIAQDIDKSGANILLVGMGMKKQEQFILKHKELFKNVRIGIGCGGSLDVFAGTVKRAPKFFQKCGLEWLYRLLKQPSRFFRMMILPKFLLLVLFKGKKLSK